MSKTATKIGVDGLVYAIMSNEGSESVAPTYGAVTSAPGVMSVGINPNASQETLFADNGPMETASTIGKIEVEIEKNALSTAEKAALLGHAVDANGAMVSGDSDIPPYVAIGFRTLKSNGKYRYVWLYKGMFNDPEDSNETKGDGINFQAETIKGQFVRIDKPYTIAGITSKPWKLELDEEHSAANPVTAAAWFSAVKLPATSADTGDDPIPVSSITVTGTGDAETVAEAATLQMLAAVLPANATDDSVTWSVTSGTGAAIISDTGLLTGALAGTVTVKAVAADGSEVEGTKVITVTA